jgi:hypothetical protein
MIIIRKTEAQNPKVKVCNVNTLEFDKLENYISSNQFTMNQRDLDENGWGFGSTETRRIIDKISSNCVKLSDYVDGSIRRGIVTGFNNAFIINKEIRDRLVSADARNSEIIKPFISGDELKRYHINSKGEYVIFTRRGIEIDRYPSLMKYLEQFKEDLVPKKAKEQKRGRKPGDYDWYEIQDSTAYFEDFEKPKIIYGEVQVSPKFSFDSSGLYLNKTIFLIPRSDLALLAILNSKMFWFLVKNYCNRVQGGYILSWKYLGNVPVPRNLPNTLKELANRMLQLNENLLSLRNKPTDERARLEEETKKTDSKIDELVYRVYGMTESEKRTIENSLNRT